MNKQRGLDKIAVEIMKCQECRRDKIGLPVPGEGNPDAKVVFIGEAPGKKESETGKPFVGLSGKFLRKMIADVGLSNDDIFITSPVKYLPKHITPKPEEVAHGRKHLFAQLEIIKPKIVVLMGRVACLAVLQNNCLIAKDHGKIIKSDGIKYFLSYHPAAALHSPRLRPVIASDFRKLKRLLKST